jgi:hypothetical protein
MFPSQLEVLDVPDLRGVLRVIPTARGINGMREAITFAGLLSLWANSDRSDNSVSISLSGLADFLGLSLSGQAVARLRESVELLKATTYQFETSDLSGGWSESFSLLDRDQTAWDGPATSPNRHIRAVFSDVVMEMVSDRRMIRPVDLDTLRRLGEQRDLARRLFLFLEGASGHTLGEGREGVHRIVDTALAGTLGVRADPRKLRQYLLRAGEAIVDTSPRYAAIDVVPRRKRGLRQGDPRYVPQVIRRRLTRAK